MKNKKEEALALLELYKWEHGSVPSNATDLKPTDISKALVNFSDLLEKLLNSDDVMKEDEDVPLSPEALVAVIRYLGTTYDF
jgi:hypothetical protein